MPKITKKEQAARDAATAQEAQLAQQARERAALRWSDDSDVAPDVSPPERGSELTTGWLFNAYARRVNVACSDVVSHAVGKTDRTTTQGAQRLYSTRTRALRALRCAMEREFAAALAKIDAEIQKEQVKGGACQH